MKKLLVLSMILAFSFGVSVNAEDADTYSGKILQKHTQKIMDAERNFNSIQKQNYDEYLKKREQRDADLQKKMNEIQQKQEQDKQEINERVEELNKSIEDINQQRQEQMRKQVEAIQNKDSNNQNIIIANQSSGQKQILATAIIWALSKLSHSQIPFIMDIWNLFPCCHKML